MNSVNYSIIRTYRDYTIRLERVGAFIDGYIEVGEECIYRDSAGTSLTVTPSQAIETCKGWIDYYFEYGEWPDEEE